MLRVWFQTFPVRGLVILLLVEGVAFVKNSVSVEHNKAKLNHRRYACSELQFKVSLSHALMWQSPVVSETSLTSSRVAPTPVFL